MNQKSYSLFNFRHGADIRTLNIMLQTSATNGTIFTKNGPQGNVWRKGQVDYRSTLPYRIIFEGIGKLIYIFIILSIKLKSYEFIILVGNSWEGDIALDDIAVNTGVCPTPGVCTFENGLCDGWEQGSDGDFEWSRGRNGSTPSGTPTVGLYSIDYSNEMRILTIETICPIFPRSYTFIGHWSFSLYKFNWSVSR